jgi:ribonuclease J
MVVSITCYGGVDEIGGNKILVTDKDTKVLLDFGAGFSEGTEFFSAGIGPRKVNGAGDYLEFGLVPALTGLYSEEALKNTEVKYCPPQVDAVLLSHYHTDHTGRIDLIDPEVPVYCGETTALMDSAYVASAGSPLKGHQLRTFRTGDKFKVGPIEVRPVHVDHSIPGAYGFILNTSEGTVVYTGDFRFHGPMGSMTTDFVDAASGSEPAVLLSEGTRVADGADEAELKESDVALQTQRLLSRSNDLDRVSSFFDACKGADRRLVVSMKVAILLDRLRDDKRLNAPRLGRDVSVYIRRKGKGAYDDGDYWKWERKFLDEGITAADIRNKQNKFLLHLDQWHLPELIDIHPEKGGAYIHATTEAFNEEGERDEQVIRNWVEHYGFSYHQIHASGHAPMKRVAELVNGVGAKRVVPIHTERADLFPSMTDSKVVIAAKGRPITVG